MTKKYVAEYRHHKPMMAAFEVKSETDKTITKIGEIEELLKDKVYYLPDRIPKSNYHIFDSQKDAIDWLISKANEDNRILRDTMLCVFDNIASLLEIKRYS